MRFTYCYKSADGIRHEEKIDASSRDEAFALLRQRGIRPIKVMADCGTKANGEVRFVVGKRLAVACAAVGLVAGVLSVLVIGRVKTIDTRSIRIKDLDVAAQEVLTDHARRMASAEVAVLGMPWELAGAKDDGKVERIVLSGYTELNITRTKLRDLFRAIYAKLPDKKEREEANKLYMAAIDRLDLEEANFARSQKAYEFLKANRNGWKIESGKVVFLVPELERNYSAFRREL